MGKETDIQWADSSLNIQMGCQGCELWREGVRACYAGNITEQYAGKKGMPQAFNLPVVFPERAKFITSWQDMTGAARPEKPWMDGLPRVIFLNDMGDTFSSGMPKDWLLEFWEAIKASPHIFIILTKRPHTGAQFFLNHGLPRNVWFLASVTGRSTASRVQWFDALREKYPEAVLGLSLEPLLDDPQFGLDALKAFNWFILGGESSQNNWQARRTPLDAFLRVYDAAGDRPVFVKQLGTFPFLLRDNGESAFSLRDAHGGDWREWDGDLRVFRRREMPRGFVGAGTLPFPDPV